MKRYTKIITLILSCLLLIGSAVGIAVAASDTPEVAIAKKNIAYEGAPKILYAVSASGKNEGDTVKIIFSDSSEIEAPTVGEALDEAAYTTDSSYVKAENASDITIAGTSYDLVYSKGTAPSDMRKPIYAMPVLTDADGVVRASGEVVEYSVYIYATNKFEAGATEDQKVLFSSLLDYGAAVQRVLADSGDTGVQDMIDAYGYADAYYGYNKVITVDGAVAETVKVRGLSVNEYICADKSYTSASVNGIFKGFTDKDGNVLTEYGEEKTASNWNYLPVTLDVGSYKSVNFNYVSDEGEYFTYENVAAKTDLPSNFTVNAFTANKTDSTTAWTAVAEENGNEYLTIGRKGADTTINPSFNFYKPTSTVAAGWEYYSYVFETDFKWNGAGENGTGDIASAFLNFSFSTYSTDATTVADAHKFVRLFLHQDANGDLMLKNQQGGQTFATLTKGDWYNLRFELIPISETKVQFNLYINGVLAYNPEKTLTASATVSGSTVTCNGDCGRIESVGFQFRGSSSATGNNYVDFALDNTYAATVYEDCENYPTGVYSSLAETFEDDTFTGTANGTSGVTVSSDKLTTKLYAWNRTNGDVWSKVVTDGENSYLDTGRNNSDSSLSSEFYFDDAELTESYKYVFETDIKWGGSGQEPIANQPMFFNIYFGTTRTTSMRPELYQTIDGELTFKNKVGSYMQRDVWYNLRVEFVANSDSSKFDMYVYVNNAEVMAGTGLALVNGSTTGTFADISKIMFEVRGSSHCAGNNYFNISFDNTFCSRVAVAAE